MKKLILAILTSLILFPLTTMVVFAENNCQKLLHTVWYGYVTTNKQHKVPVAILVNGIQYSFKGHNTLSYKLSGLEHFDGKENIGKLDPQSSYCAVNTLDGHAAISFNSGNTNLILFTSMSANSENILNIVPNNHSIVGHETVVRGHLSKS